MVSYSKCKGAVLTAVMAAWLPVALIAAPTVQAKSLVYKWTDRNGITTYSEKLPDGVADVQAIEIESLSPEEKLAASKILSETRRKMEAQNASAKTRQKAADDAAARVDKAIKALKLAEAELAAADTPGEGDRIGIAGGGSKLTDTYFERKSRLQANVDAARKQLDEAFAAQRNVK